MPSNIIKVTLAHLTVLLGTSSSKAIAFLTSILLARALGAESFGQYSLFQAAMLITSQIPQAFDTAFVRYAKSNDSKNDLRQWLAGATRLKIYLSILMAAFAIPIAAIINHLSKDNENVGLLVAYGIICGVFICFISSIANVMRVREHFWKYSVLQAIYNFAILASLGAAILFVDKLDTTLTVSIYIGVAFCFGVICMFLITKAAGNPFNAPEHVNKVLFSFSKWVLLTVVAYYFFSRIDVLMLSSFMPFGDVGIYSAAGQLTMAVSMLIGAGSTVFMPRSINAIQTKENLITYFKEIIAPTVMILFGIAMLYYAAPFLFRVLFSEVYAESASILRILLFGYVFVAIYTPLSFLFYALNRPDLRFYLEAIKLITTILTLYISIPIFGLYGAAWSMAACMCLNSFIATTMLSFFIRRKFASGLNDEPLRFN